MAVKIEPKVKKATVTFTTEPREDASKAILTGDWDDWTPLEMKKNTNGTFSAKLSIDLGKTYQFGYSIDGTWTPEAVLTLITSPFGTKNSVLDLTGTSKASERETKYVSKGKPAAAKKPAKRSL